MLFFFFSSRRRHTRFDCDWSSDVCSSDLGMLARTKTACPRTSAYPALDLFALTAHTGGLGERLRSRSEERRVGKECRSRGAAFHLEIKGRVKVSEHMMMTCGVSRSRA